MKGKWKQNSKKKKNAVLQKYMAAVGEFVQSKSGTGEEGRDHVVRFVKKKSRKELRKEKRKLKKAKMKSHYEGNKTLTLPCGDGESRPQVSKKKKSMKKVTEELSETNANQSDRAPVGKSKAPQSSKKGKKVNKLQESRKMALQEANEQEDREIKKLERCLGLNKRKNKKSLPQSFVADGLDYILGVLDSGSSAGAVYDDDDDMDVAKANFEDLGKNDSELSDEDLGDGMASEVSDEDMGSSVDGGDEDEIAEEEEEDEMVEEEEEDEIAEEEEEEEDEIAEEEEEEEDEMAEEEEAAEKEMEDDQDDMEESDGETGKETDTLFSKTSQSKPETVSGLQHWYRRY